MTNYQIILIDQTAFNLWATGLSFNIDFGWLNPTLRNVQVQYLRPLLTKPLFDAIMQAAEGNTLTQEQQYLIDTYIAPYLANMALYSAAYSFQHRTEAKGTMYGTDKDAAPTPDEEIERIRNQWRGTAETWAKEMVCYIQAHREDYPEYPHHKCDAPAPKPGLAFYRSRYQKYGRSNFGYCDDCHNC